jgi:hypothetical protein
MRKISRAMRRMNNHQLPFRKDELQNFQNPGLGFQNARNPKSEIPRDGKILIAGHRILRA